MDEKQLERIAVAFERIAAAQEHQSEYLMEIKTQYATQYKKYDVWRETDELFRQEADARKEREVRLSEIRYELELATLKVKLEYAEDEFSPQATRLRELMEEILTT